MEFSANHPILFVMVGIIIAAVLGQSFYFLFRSQDIVFISAHLHNILPHLVVFVKRNRTFTQFARSVLPGCILFLSVV